MRRKRQVIAVAAVASLAACSAALAMPRGGTAAHQAAAGGQLVFQFPTAPLDLDPATSQDNNVSIPLWLAWFQPLISQAPGGGKFTPVLADRWTASKDGKTYTFHIRPGVQFSNGKPMTAQDVLSSLQRSMAPKISLLHFLVAKIASIGASGSTVKIVLKQPWPHLLADLATPNGAIYPKGAFTKATAKAFFFQHPIGTGPFQLVSSVPNSSYVVTPNPHYWNHSAEPKLGRITFQVVTDDTARANAVRGGRADVAVSPPANLLSSLKSASNLKVVSVPSSLVELIALNTKRAPFDSQKVRRAISLAIDRSSIIKSGLFGYAQPATTFLVGPPKASFQNPKLNLYPYDLAQAKKLMQQSGVKTPITLPFEVSTGTAQDAILNVVQSNLSQIGIKVSAVRKDSASVDNDIIGEKYAMNTTFWGDMSGDPSIQVLFAVDPAYCCDSYFTGYNDKDLITLAHKAINTRDHGAAQKQFDQIQRRVADEAFLIPLYYPDLIYMTSSRVHGFNVSPYGFYDWAAMSVS